MIARRALVAFGIAWCGAALAQGAPRRFRLGILSTGAQSLPGIREFLMPAMERLGYRAGHNLAVDVRSGEGPDLDRLAQELAAWPAEVLLTIANPASAAAARATRTIPIVTYGADPVRMGLAATNAKPGGNVTGVAILAAELDGKRLALLIEAVPGVRRFGVLFHTASAELAERRREVLAVAAGHGVSVTIAETAGPEGHADAFDRFREAGVEALAISAHALLYRDLPELLRLSGEARLPTICEWREMAEKGCLIGYGPKRSEIYARAAGLVAKLLDGARPSELPVEHPVQLDLAVNLKVARALGLTLPPAILARADEVIE